MGTNNLKPDKNTALAIFCVGVTAFAALNCLQPIIPAIGRGLGLPPAAASLISSAGMLGVAFMLFALTFLAERLPRRKSLALALGVCSSGTALLGLLPDFSLMLAARFITGMSIAFHSHAHDGLYPRRIFSSANCFHLRPIHQRHNHRRSAWPPLNQLFYR